MSGVAVLCCAVCQRGMYFTVDFSRAETSVCKVIFFFNTGRTIQ